MYRGYTCRLMIKRMSKGFFDQAVNINVVNKMDWIFLYSKLDYLKFDFSKIGLRP